MVKIDLTVLILAKNEAKNIAPVIVDVRDIINSLKISGEIVVVDGNSHDDTYNVAQQAGAKVIVQSKSGFGNALREGFGASKGEYILTMDADLSHHPLFIHKMWAHRKEAAVIIGSRYVAGGRADMPLWRMFLSKILNYFYASGLAIPIKDMSSNYRIYKADRIKELQLEGKSFDIIQEILVKIYISGYTAKEVPIYYRPRKNGVSNARVIPFGIQLIIMFLRLWRMRKSILSADYDEMAYFSKIPFQRYWQRKRLGIIMNYSINIPFVLDAGCGSSMILRSHPNIVGLDISLPKLLYMRKYSIPLLQGSIYTLPFKSQVFDGVICSEVVEHISNRDNWLQELKRVIKPKGYLILGTPDYGRIWWPIIEQFYKLFLPRGYADEHISQYNFTELKELLIKENFEILSYEYILGAELIICARLK